MFKFNRFFFIFSNFIISFLIFSLIFYIRYQSFLFKNIEKRNFDIYTIFTFLFYSFIIVLLNISFKIYEINKISKVKESILLNFFISIVSIGVIGGYYFYSGLNFARFVFFVGFIVIPFIISLFNKILIILLKPKRAYKILYLGSENNFKLFNELVYEYKKLFDVELFEFITNDNIQKLKDNLNLSDLVVVDTDQIYSKEIVSILNDYEINNGRIYSLVDMFAYFDQSLPAEIIKNQHFEFFSSYKLDSLYNVFFKRIGDIIISTFLIILTAPIMIITAILIKITSKGPILYSQKRVGYKGKEFNMLKFRSMIVNAEKEGIQFTKVNDSRITFIGKIIRPLRIDELPQLFNIFKGDMSFIGPRPERKEFIDKITQEFPLFKKRLLVKPGLSGWAQVKYTYVNQISKMNKKLSYDLYYINNLSLFFDIKILLYTIETVIFRRGAI